MIFEEVAEDVSLFQHSRVTRVDTSQFEIPKLGASVLSVEAPRLVLQILFLVDGVEQILRVPVSESTVRRSP